MWNQQAEQQQLEAKLRNKDLSLKELIQTQLSLAYIERYSFADCKSRLEEVKRLLDGQPEAAYASEHAHALHIQQYCVLSYGEVFESLKAGKRALEAYQTLGDPIGEAHTLRLLLYASTISYNQRYAHQYAEQLRTLVDHSQVIAHLKSQLVLELSNFYHGLKLLDLARIYGQKATEYEDTRFQGLWVLSAIAASEDNLPKALEFVQQAAQIATAANNPNWLMAIETRLSFCFRNLGRHQEALAMLQQAINNYEVKDDSRYGDAAVELGRVYRDLGQFEEAEAWMQQARTIFKERDAKSSFSIATKDLSDLYYQWGRYKESVEYIKAYNKLHKEVIDEQQQAEIAFLAAQHEFQLSQKELEFSRLENDILAHQNNRLQAAYNEQKEILNIVAHDLKNPLTSISLKAESSIQLILQKKYDRLLSPPQRILKIVGYMMDIINQLTTMGHIDSGDEEVDLQRLHIQQLLNAVIDQHRESLNDKQIALDLIMPQELDVLADEAMIQRVLDNLLSNSIKYSHPDSTVRIIVLEEKQRVRIVFSDQGVGIAPDEMPKLFTKFGRLSARPTANESSTGLGLYITKKLLELMGGEIEASSAGLGSGTTFTIWLNCAPAYVWEDAATLPD